MARKIQEWIAKHDDQKVPDRVRDRIYQREDGKCHICETAIAGKRWDADHKKALKDGGEHRESNLFPAHTKCHKRKTAQEAAERAKVTKVRQKNTGVKRPKQTIQSRGFTKTDKPRKIDKKAIEAAALPRTGGLAAQIREVGE